MPVVKITHRIGSTEEWATANPVLLKGERGIETILQGHKEKIGDGVTPWNELPYYTEGSVTAKIGAVPIAIDDGNGKPSFHKSWGLDGVFAGMVCAFSGTFGGPEGKNPIPTGEAEPRLDFELFEPMVGMFIKGGNGTDTGITGGASTTQGHTLTIDQMPAHLHTSDNHSHSASYASASTIGNVTTGEYGQTVVRSVSNHGSSTSAVAVAINSTGGSKPHAHTQNDPPYYTLAWVIKLPS